MQQDPRLLAVVGGGCPCRERPLRLKADGGVVAAGQTRRAEAVHLLLQEARLALRQAPTVRPCSACPSIRPLLGSLSRHRLALLGSPPLEYSVARARHAGIKSSPTTRVCICSHAIASTASLHSPTAMVSPRLCPVAAAKPPSPAAHVPIPALSSMRAHHLSTWASLHSPPTQRESIVCHCGPPEQPGVEGARKPAAVRVSGSNTNTSVNRS